MSLSQSQNPDRPEVQEQRRQDDNYFAKLNNLHPEAYIREVLTRIAEYPIGRIIDLLQWNIDSQKKVST